MPINMRPLVNGIAFTAFVIVVASNVGPGPEANARNQIQSSRGDFARAVLRPMSMSTWVHTPTVIMRRRDPPGTLVAFDTHAREVAAIAPHPHDDICMPTRYFVHNRKLVTVCHDGAGNAHLRIGNAYAPINDTSSIALGIVVDSEGEDAVYCRVANEIRLFNLTSLHDEYTIKPAHERACTRFMFVRVAANVVWLMGGVCDGQISNGVTQCDGSQCTHLYELDMPITLADGAAIYYWFNVYITGGYSNTTMTSNLWFAYDRTFRKYTPLWKLGGGDAIGHRVAIIDGSPHVVGGGRDCEIEGLSAGTELLCGGTRVDYVGIV
jgi:hypothetical protein